MFKLNLQGFPSHNYFNDFSPQYRILEGGIASGLNKVDLSLKPSLYQVKGKRSPVIREVVK
jgi:hypothetical protein